jgi:hypothetical protein
LLKNSIPIAFPQLYEVSISKEAPIVNDDGNYVEVPLSPLNPCGPSLSLSSGIPRRELSSMMAHKDSEVIVELQHNFHHH